MPPKDYDLLCPVYGSSIYGEISNVQPVYNDDPVHILITLLNIVIGNLDQYTENEILETLPKIEKAICDLPIDESVKPRLCDILWTTRVTVGASLRAITSLLSNQSYIATFQNVN